MRVAASCFLIFFCFTIGYGQSKKPDPFKSDYVKYAPGFVKAINELMRHRRWPKKSKKEMERSSEKLFYTLSEVEEVNRANALVKAAVDSESKGDYRKAMTMYHNIISKFNKSQGYKEILFRVSKYGVFVPVAQYCQRRILNFPPEHLNFYRTLHDAEAKELFLEAKRKYSLELFSEIVDQHLATSYGGRALQFLGDAALDRGNTLEALEYYNTIISNIPDKKLQTPELALKIEYCQKSIGVKKAKLKSKTKSSLASSDLQKLTNIAKSVKFKKQKSVTQRNSKGYEGADDYNQYDYTDDPLGLKKPEWETPLENSRNDFFIFAKPVVTNTSVIVRYKNVIYCYSLINGELRWKNNIGGRSVWQSKRERQYPWEDIIVSDGVVITPMIKGGSSLLALDEITGQIKWTHGPIAVSDGDESRMRFECAPTAGPGTIYANYVLDNIKGATHIDTEYGVIAYDTITGRMKWRRQISRLLPGKFDGGFGVVRKNRIRSFFSPPLYNQGTIYINTNAGTIAALNSISGRIKWLFRYPYYSGVHDLTRTFGRLSVTHGSRSYLSPQQPSFWFNQRPLIVGDALYITPVDCPFLLSINRKTGKTNWVYRKPTGNFEYFLGPLSTGELVISGSGRKDVMKPEDTYYGQTNCAFLLDPKTGKTIWRAHDYVKKDPHPVMKWRNYQTPAWMGMNTFPYACAGRPFLTKRDTLIITGWTDHSVYYRPGMYAFALGEIDFKKRKTINKRRYYSGTLLAHVDHILNDTVGGKHGGARPYLKGLKAVPRPSKKIKSQIKMMTSIVNDTMPTNDHPAFMPFIRMTFKRYGVSFELRLSARKLMMVYDRKKFEQVNKNNTDLISIFGKAEMAKKDGDYPLASKYLSDCLAKVSPEDVNFRALIKQQFYKVYKELVRSAIRGKFNKIQLKNTLGMSKTASVLAEEVETLFALAEGYAANGKFKNAANCLRNLIEIFGSQEFPISNYAAANVFQKALMQKMKVTSDEIFEDAKKKVNPIYANESIKTIELFQNSLSLYTSAVSPLPKEMYLRTGDLAINKLVELLNVSGNYKNEYTKLAESDLNNDNINKLIYHIWKYPGTEVGQKTFDKIFTLMNKLSVEDQNKILLKLKHIAKVCHFKMPASKDAFFNIPKYDHYQKVNKSFGNKEFVVEKYKDGIMMLMERSGDRSIKPDLLFLSVRLPKRIGNKFSIVCFDLAKGKEVWRKKEFRLKGLGKEPGFYKAYVHKNKLVVHGVSDVYGFELETGKEIWHFKTPDSFEIQSSLISGNLFYICSDNETLALQIDTKSPVGELAWQQREDGQIYLKPYFVDDYFISVRKYPFNITTRYRTTGSLVRRMAIPDLMLNRSHPFVKKAEKKLSVASYGKYIVVTDRYYILVYDVYSMRMVWKTLVTSKDWSNETSIRFVINDKYVVLTKMDYDQKIMYCYDLKTGKLRWKTDYKIGTSPRPLYSLMLEGDHLYGIEEYSGQGFYFTAYNCATGKKLFRNLYKGFTEKPNVSVKREIYDGHFIVQIQDRKKFHILVLDQKSGKEFKKITSDGDGPIGAPGRVSMTAQNGHPVLFSKIKFKY